MLVRKAMLTFSLAAGCFSIRNSYIYVTGKTALTLSLIRPKQLFDKNGWEAYRFRRLFIVSIMVAYEKSLFVLAHPFILYSYFNCRRSLSGPCCSGSSAPC